MANFFVMKCALQTLLFGSMILLTVTCYSQEQVSYLYLKPRKVNLLADMDFGTTIAGGFTFGMDVQAEYRKNLFVLFTTNSIVKLNSKLDFNPFSSSSGLVVSTTDLNSFQFGTAYGRVFEHKRFQLAGYVGPTYIILRSENIFSIYGSISPSFYISPNMNIGVNIYGMIVETAPPMGFTLRARYLLNNRRTYISKQQQEKSEGK